MLKVKHGLSGVERLKRLIKVSLFRFDSLKLLLSLVDLLYKPFIPVFLLVNFVNQTVNLVDIIFLPVDFRFSFVIDLLKVMNLEANFVFLAL